MIRVPEHSTNTLNACGLVVLRKGMAVRMGRAPECIAAAAHTHVVPFAHAPACGCLLQLMAYDSAPSSSLIVHKLTRMHAYKQSHRQTIAHTSHHTC